MLSSMLRWIGIDAGRPRLLVKMSLAAQTSSWLLLIFSQTPPAGLGFEKLAALREGWLLRQPQCRWERRNKQTKKEKKIKKMLQKESSIFPWRSKGNKNVILVNKWCGEVEEKKQTNKIIRSHHVAHSKTRLAFKLFAALLSSRGKRAALQACLHCIVCQRKPVWHPKDNWRREEGQLLSNLSLLFASHSSLTLFYSTLCCCCCFFSILISFPGFHFLPFCIG